MKRMNPVLCPCNATASPPRPWAHRDVCRPQPPTTVRSTVADSGSLAQEPPDVLSRAPVQSFSNLPRVRVCKIFFLSLFICSFWNFIFVYLVKAWPAVKVMTFFVCSQPVVPEELRHSMPNLAPRTSLRSLEAVRNSRSMEANLQSSGNRMSHLTPSPSSGNPCLFSLDPSSNRMTSTCCVTYPSAMTLPFHHPAATSDCFNYWN